MGTAQSNPTKAQLKYTVRDDCDSFKHLLSSSSLT